MTTKIKGFCGRIVVWAPPGRKTTTFASTKSCGSILCGAGRCVDALALGDGHVAWITRAGGTTSSSESAWRRSRVGRAGDRLGLERERRRGRSERRLGRELVGGGSWLGYDNWDVCFEDHPGSDCQPGDPETGRKNEKLVRISAGHRVVVKRGADAYRLAAAGGGRIAVETKAPSLFAQFVAPASRRSPPWTGIRRAPSR